LRPRLCQSLGSLGPHVPVRILQRRHEDGNRRLREPSDLVFSVLVHPGRAGQLIQDPEELTHTGTVVGPVGVLDESLSIEAPTRRSAGAMYETDRAYAIDHEGRRPVGTTQ